MAKTTLCALAVLVALLWTQMARTADQASQPLTPAQQMRLKERDRYAAETAKLRASGKLSEAIDACQKMLAIERELFGNYHNDVAESLKQLAKMCQQQGDFAAAHKARQEVIAIASELHGPSNWRTADAGRALEDLERWIGWDAQSRRQALEADQLNVQVRRLVQQGRDLEALPMAQRVNSLRKTLLTENHPLYAESLNNLAFLYQDLGNYSLALPLHLQARDLRKKLLTENHPNYADSLSNLASLYRVTGDYAKALPLYIQSRDLQKKLQTENHPDYATSLNNLAFMYHHMGDYAQALPLYLQARDLRKRLLTEKHPEYATSLNNLAMLYMAVGDHASALPLLRRACELKKELPTQNYTSYANSLANLAMLYQAIGEYGQAVPLLEQAHEVYKTRLTENHPLYSQSLNNLALLHQYMGNYDQALVLFRQALNLTKSRLTESHHQYALILQNLALLYQDMGDYTQALPLAQQALAVTEQHLELAAAAQAERQQLAMVLTLHSRLSTYLTSALPEIEPAQRCYGAVLAWKGAVFARQRLQRLHRLRPELVEEFAQLNSVNTRLASLALGAPSSLQPAVYRHQLAELSEKKEKMEQMLAARSAEYRQAQERLTPAGLQALLPRDAILVDFLEYLSPPPPTPGKQRQPWRRKLAAFVVRPDALYRVELGLSIPVGAAIRDWRVQLVGKGTAIPRRPVRCAG